MTKENNTSSIIVRLPPTKFWEKHILKCQQHKCEQEVHRLRTNPDTRLAHPAECRGNPEGKMILHPETKARILKDLEKKLKGIERPPTVMPTRFNRS